MAIVTAGPGLEPGGGGGARSTGWAVPAFVDRTLGRFDQRRVTATIVALAALLAFLTRWTQDDSYISLRYARNLAEGNGLVYNPGELVEGYTNFLWTVLMAVPIRLGVDPVLFGHLLGIVCMVATMLAVVVVATRVFGSPVLANLCLLVLLTNTSFVAYGTGGLETQLQTSLVAVVWLLALPALGVGTRRLEVPALLLMSLASGLVLLTRLDSAVVIVVPAAAVAWAVLRDGRRRVVELAALLGPVLVLVVPWTVWRWSTYGSLLPNTAIAKENPLRISVLQGASYLAVFVAVNLLFVFVPPAFLRGRDLLRRAPFAAIAATLGLWVLYLLKVGADFMEFRFMVVVLPLLSLVLVALVLLTHRAGRQKLLLGVLVASMFVHLVVMGSTGGVANLDSTGYLDGFVTDPQSGLAALGDELREVLDGSADAEQPDSGAVVISTGGAGAIPYQARLRNVDPLGLTDPWTAENGIRLETETIPKQGHSRMATFEHLTDEGANVLIGTRGQPRGQEQGYGWDDLLGMFRGAEPDVEHLRDGVTMIEIPMADGTVYPAVYLIPHDDIDAAITSGRWRELPLATTPEG
jgi:arabinofuranosyltransferase